MDRMRHSSTVFFKTTRTRNSPFALFRHNASEETVHEILILLMAHHSKNSVRNIYNNFRRHNESLPILVVPTFRDQFTLLTLRYSFIGHNSIPTDDLKIRKKKKPQKIPRASFKTQTAKSSKLSDFDISA